MEIKQSLSCRDSGKQPRVTGQQAASFHPGTTQPKLYNSDWKADVRQEDGEHFSLNLFLQKAGSTDPQSLL